MRSSILLAALRFAFRRRHSDRYVVREMRRLLCGQRHSVLGNHVKDETATRLEAMEFLQSLRRLGLGAADRCVEIGCGSLWAAEPVIEFLPPDSFFGLDVSDAFFRAGMQRLPRTLLQDKRPAFSVISPKSLVRARRFRPTFIFSRKTLIHVPPAELRPFLDQSCALMSEATICAHELPSAPGMGYQFNRFSWAHSLADLRAALPGGYDLEYRENAFVIRRRRDRK